MCGIFGYVQYHLQEDQHYDDAVGILVDGLRHLEYRGYDSAGLYMTFSSLSESGDAQHALFVKSVGNIERLHERVASSLKTFPKKNGADACMGIAHTRWATHGPPSEQNTHPHVSDPDHTFVVVHNGIITNYAALRTFLESQGYTFCSDTDTEVIPILCKYVYDTTFHDRAVPFYDLIKCVMDRLEGSFAILVMSKHFPMQMVATKKGSPLILGIQEMVGTHASSEYVIASDLNAIIRHTKRTIVLLDDDILHISRDEYRIYNAQEIVTRDLQIMDMEISNIMKGKYDYFMEKEIFEQPHSLQQTMNGRISYSNDEIKMGGILEHLHTIRHSTRLVFIASGTSYHACVATRPLFERLIPIPISVENSCDFVDRGANVFPNDTCIFVSQSGETADVLVALRNAMRRHALCIGITNIVGSTISRETQCGIHVNAGTEIGVASTKSYTSQVIVMTLLALVIANDSIETLPIRKDILNTLRNLKPLVRSILGRSHEFETLAKEMMNERNILFIGRGRNYATALEASLKIKEVAYIHCEGLIAGELKHGPLALIDPSVLVIIIATADDRIKSSIEQLLSRNARILIMTDDPDMYPHQRRIVMPKIQSSLHPILDILPFQLIAYYIARAKGYNVDQPRNLAKAVTVTD